MIRAALLCLLAVSWFSPVRAGSPAVQHVRVVYGQILRHLGATQEGVAVLQRMHREREVYGVEGVSDSTLGESLRGLKLLKDQLGVRAGDAELQAELEAELASLAGERQDAQNADVRRRREIRRQSAVHDSHFKVRLPRLPLPRKGKGNVVPWTVSLNRRFVIGIEGLFEEKSQHLFLDRATTLQASREIKKNRMTDKAMTPVLAPDDHTVFFQGDEPHALVERDLTNGQERTWQFPKGFAYFTASPSPDGHILWVPEVRDFVNEKRQRTYYLDRRSGRKIEVNSAFAAEDAAFAPDSKHAGLLYQTKHHWKARVVDLTDGAQRVFTLGRIRPNEWIHALGLTDTELRWIDSSPQGIAVHRRDLRTGEALETREFDTSDDAKDWDFSADGRVAVAERRMSRAGRADEKPGFYFVDLESGRQVFGQTPGRIETWKIEAGGSSGRGVLRVFYYDHRQQQRTVQVTDLGQLLKNRL